MVHIPKRILCLAVAFLVPAALAAQSRPNFSGTFTPIPEKTEPEFVRPGPAVVIRQDAKMISVTFGSGPTVSYRLDGQPSRREVKEDGIARTVTARASWSGSVLRITEDVGVKKQEYTYLFNAPGELVITSATTLLHTRGGQLTVSTIGPTTRVYRKGK